MISLASTWRVSLCTAENYLCFYDSVMPLRSIFSTQLHGCQTRFPPGDIKAPLPDSCQAWRKILALVVMAWLSSTKKMRNNAFPRLRQKESAILGFLWEGKLMINSTSPAAPGHAWFTAVKRFDADEGAVRSWDRSIVRHVFYLNNRPYSPNKAGKNTNLGAVLTNLHRCTKTILLQFFAFATIILTSKQAREIAHCIGTILP